MADSNRTQKVAQLFQKELSELVRKKVKEHTANAVVSVTEVRITPDLSLARVFVSVFPVNAADEIFAWIQEHQGYFRSTLAKGVAKKMRVMPQLYFRLDESFEKMEQIDKALRGEGDNPIL